MRGLIFLHSAPPTPHGEAAVAALAGVDWGATPYVHLWYPGDGDAWEAAPTADPESSGARTAQARSTDPWLSVDLATYYGDSAALAVAVHVATRRSWWGSGVTTARCRLADEVWTVAGLAGGALIDAAMTVAPGASVSGITDLADLAAELGL